MKCNRIRFIFLHIPFCDPHNPSIGVAVLGSRWWRNFYPVGKKKDHQQQTLHYNHCDTGFPVQWFFHVGKLMIVGWGEIRRIGRMINQFRSAITHSSHWNQGLVCWSTVLTNQFRFTNIHSNHWSWELVCWSIVPMKQDPCHQFSWVSWKPVLTASASQQSTLYWWCSPIEDSQ